MVFLEFLFLANNRRLLCEQILVCLLLRQNILDLVAIDESHKRILAAECKYYKDDKPVDVNVYAKLVEKCQVDDFKGYDLTYGIFSKSGFTKHLRDIAKENKKLILIDECDMVK